MVFGTGFEVDSILAVSFLAVGFIPILAGLGGILGSALGGGGAAAAGAAAGGLGSALSRIFGSDAGIAGIMALGDFLAGSAGPEPTRYVGRPDVAFGAQDQARSAITGELARAQAARALPIGLPTIDLPQGYGQIAQIPGLDISLGLNPGLLSLGNQDFFGDINAQRAQLNEQFPPTGGRRRAVPRQPREMTSERAFVPETSETVSQETGQQQFQDPEGTLDMIGEAIAALMERTAPATQLREGKR